MRSTPATSQETLSADSSRISTLTVGIALLSYPCPWNAGLGFKTCISAKPCEG